MESNDRILFSQENECTGAAYMSLRILREVAKKDIINTFNIKLFKMENEIIHFRTTDIHQYENMCRKEKYQIQNSVRKKMVSLCGHEH